MLDCTGQALGVPVYDLCGGPVLDRCPVYWSHCGTYRVRNAEAVGVPPLRNYDDVAALGAEGVVGHVWAMSGRHEAGTA